MSNSSNSCGAFRPCVLSTGIGVQTLSDWKKEHPELPAILEAAQEELRQKALQVIKDAVESGDLNAAVKALQLVFPEYRQNQKVEVNANASATAVVSRRQQLKAHGIWEPPTAEDSLTPEEIAQLQQAHRERMERIAKLHNDACKGALDNEPTKKRPDPNEH